MTLTKDEAEALMFEKQAEMFAAQAKEAEAKAKKEEHYAENARVSRDETLRREKISLVQDHYLHEFRFNVGVNEESVEICSNQLDIWHRQDPTCSMTIKIDSPGGSVFDGLHLFDEISAYSLREWDTRDIPKGTHHTTMIVRGMAASMGGILLQAADRRICGPESLILVHEVSTMSVGKIGELKDDVKLWDKVSDRITDIFVRRSGGKLTKAKFNRLWQRKDWWLTSSEAFELGMVDEIG